MISKTRRASVLAILLILSLTLPMGCARTYDETGTPIPPSPEEIAGMIQGGFQGLTVLAITVVRAKAPEHAAEVENKFVFALAQLDYINTSGITVASVSGVLTNLFTELNGQFQIIDDSDAAIVLTSVAVIANIAQGYFVSYTPPDDIKKYSEGAAAGIKTALEQLGVSVQVE